MSERIKVAEIITRLEPGGSTNIVLALCERLDPAHFDVTLIAGPTPGPAPNLAEFSAHGIRVFECPHLIRNISPLADLRAFLWLRKRLAALRPDIVHTHTSKAGALGRAACRFLRKTPLVHTPHGHVYHGYGGRFATRSFIFAERMLAPLADRITVLTDMERVDNLERNIGKAPQYITIPSAIDLDRFHPDPDARTRIRSELGLANRFLIGWVGRLTHIKGPDIFIDAAAEIAAHVPEAAFIIAGGGELLGLLRIRANELGIEDRCRFLGPRDDIPELLAACNLFVLSSRNEGLGLAAVEAMACGLPVIATDVGGVRELLQDGRCGKLVPPTPHAIAAAVADLAADPLERTALAEAGLARAKDFDISQMVRRFAELYEELAP